MSASGTAFVWGSVATVTSLYYAALPQAGLVLAPSVVWLTIASYLVRSGEAHARHAKCTAAANNALSLITAGVFHAQVYCIWQLNDPEKHPLYPPKM